MNTKSGDIATRQGLPYGRLIKLLGKVLPFAKLPATR